MLTRDAVGRAFRWEYEMLPPLIANVGHWLPDGAVAVVCEVPCPSGGVPDVVALTLDQSNVEQRRLRGLGPLLDVQEVLVLQVMGHEPFSVSDLASVTGTPPGRLRSTVLPRLCAAGWVRELASPGGRKYVLLHEHQEVASRVVTVEVKKSDWRRGFHQALRHAASADVSLLALDEATSARARAHASEMESLGVGLTTIDARSGSVSSVTFPSPRTTRSAMRTVMIERTWALHQSGASAGPTFPVFGRHLASPSR